MIVVFNGSCDKFFVLNSCGVGGNGCVGYIEWFVNVVYGIDYMGRIEILF